jgi:hypothetical protein
VVDFAALGRLVPSRRLARLTVGFRAEARYAPLTLHQAGRIVEEVQTDPKHLIRRTLVNPDAEQ